MLPADEKPFRFDTERLPLEGPPEGFHDRQIGVMALQGQFHEARVTLTERSLTAKAPELFQDAMRLERIAQPSEQAWWAWLGRGLMSADTMAEHLPDWLDTRELGRFMADGRVTWQALSSQRDEDARLALFAQRLAYLLWQGRESEALDALEEDAFIQHCGGSEEGRKVAEAALYVAAWDDPERAGLLAARYAEQAPDALATYPADLLLEALQRTGSLARVDGGATCPPSVARALRLGPVFGGTAARELLDRLAAGTQADATGHMRFCEVAEDRAPGLTLWLAALFTTLSGQEASRAASDAPLDEPLSLAARAVAEDRLPRVLWGGAGLTAAALAVTSVWLGVWGWVLAAGSFLLWLPLFVRLRATVHARTLRGRLADVMAGTGVRLPELVEAMARQRALGPFVPHAAADASLALFGAIAAADRRPPAAEPQSPATT